MNCCYVSVKLNHLWHLFDWFHTNLRIVHLSLNIDSNNWCPGANTCTYEPKARTFSPNWNWVYVKTWHAHAHTHTQNAIYSGVSQECYEEIVSAWEIIFCGWGMKGRLIEDMAFEISFDAWLGFHWFSIRHSGQRKKTDTQTKQN